MTHLKELEKRKAQFLEIYKKARAQYLKTGTPESWVEFCKAKKNCMLLGVRI